MYNARLPPQPPQEPHTFGDNITSNATGQKESDREHIFTTNIKLASCKKKNGKIQHHHHLSRLPKLLQPEGQFFHARFLRRSNFKKKIAKALALGEEKFSATWSWSNTLFAGRSQVEVGN